MAGVQMLPDLRRFPQLFGRHRWLVYCRRNSHWEVYGDRPGTFVEVLAILFNGGVQLIYKPGVKWRVVLLPRGFKWARESHGRVPQIFFHQNHSLAVFRCSQLGTLRSLYREGHDDVASRSRKATK